MVSVDENKTNVDVYLFVKFVEANNEVTGLNDGIIQYTSTLTEANGWTALSSVDNVWYRVVKNNDETQSWNLIAGDKVTINSELTKELMPKQTMPSLTYTAYAIQYSGFEPEVSDAAENPTDEQKQAAALKAWNNISKD